MDVVNPSVMVSRLDLVVLDSAVAGIDFRRLLQGFWNIGVFIEQRVGSGGTRGGHNPPGRAWASMRALVVVPPSEHPLGASPAHWMSSGPKKSTKSFTAFGLHFILITCDVKNMQKKQQLALGTMLIGYSKKRYIIALKYLRLVI